MHRDDMVSIFADLLFMTQIRLHLSVDSLERSNRVHQIEIWTVYPAGFYSILTLTQFLYTRCMGKNDTLSVEDRVKRYKSSPAVNSEVDV